MKKIFITIVAAFMAVAGLAQTTFNVRAGGGTFLSNDYISEIGALTFEGNISLGERNTGCVFSPSMFILSDFADHVVLNVPFHFGYKMSMDNGSFFIPKIGPMLGLYIGSFDNSFAYGPSAELAFEIKHFIIAANGFYDVNNKCTGILCTIGYKF